MLFRIPWYHYHKAFCKSTEGSFDRSIMYGIGKSVSRVSVLFRKKKILPLSWWKQSNVINLPPENGAISGTQCWSLLLADWAFSSGYNQVSLNEWTLVLLNPWVMAITATMAFLSKNPLVMIGWLRKEPNGVHRLGHPIHFIKILFCWAFNMGHKELHFYPCREVYTSFPDFLHMSFPIMFLPSSWPPSQTTGHSLWIVHLTISSSKQENKTTKTQVHCLKLWPVGLLVPSGHTWPNHLNIPSILWVLLCIPSLIARSDYTQFMMLTWWPMV